MAKTAEQIRGDLLRPLFRTGAGYRLAVSVTGSMVLAGVFAFSYQIYHGLGVWGLNWPVFWAFDITNFVFWIGITPAGTLIPPLLPLPTPPSPPPAPPTPQPPTPLPPP